MVDPKVVELGIYNGIPHLLIPVVTEPKKAAGALTWAVTEMTNRYRLFAESNVRDLRGYNELVKERGEGETLPHIVIIIDELADLMMVAPNEVEDSICRLAQMARAAGMHLVIATQRPSVNVITGVIKANFSARAAYQVATKIDSRTILDMNGAEQLLGSGDMLFLPGGMPKPIRIQNAFISTEEVEKITNFIYLQPGFSKRYFLPSLYEKKKAELGNFLSDLDPMFEEAARVVVRHQQGSVSLLQRRLKLGYSRAARIVDQLEQAGIVGGSEGSKAREVIVESEEQLETILRSL